MTRPVDGHRREWKNGHSRLVVERDVDGRVLISVHDTDKPGYSVSVDPTTATEIADYIEGGKP